MQYKIKDKMVDVVVEKKNNKNMYLRIKDNNVIYITAPKMTFELSIKMLINQNEDYIYKMLLRQENKTLFNDEFRYLGKKYDIIILPTVDIEFINDKVYVKSMEYLNNWIDKKTKELFNERIKYNYDKFEENIPYPKVKIRKMKTRWGVNNRRDNSVTLNSELIKYDIEKLDYVIIHELSHFKWFDHSSNFWNLVSKYEPNYKKIRKELRY